MKKCFVIVACAMSFFGCSEEASINSKNVVSNDSSLAEEEYILPYFDFGENGQRIRYEQGVRALFKQPETRNVLIVGSFDEFAKLERDYAIHLQEDVDYKRSIERPLDYVCRLSLLAMGQNYEYIMTQSGDTLLSDKIIYEGCEYIGLECDDCDESSEEDPYLKHKTLKKIAKEESFENEVSVEVYPYRMVASSFITNISSLYSSAGAETYFKKRQQVWRGPFVGTVWRWAAFDPDRNGVRAYCFERCTVDAGALSCTKPTSSSDLDTSGDTEDITERCALRFGISVSGSIDDDGPSDVSVSPVNDNVKEFNGGVVGLHYVKHKDIEFKAMTSKGFSSEVRKLLHTYSGFNYR